MAAATLDPNAPRRGRWVATAVVLLGSVIVTIDMTIVNVALHPIEVDLGGGTTIDWVATAYFLGVCGVLPATGWLADRFGRKRVFLVSLAFFTLASVACALSFNLPMLIGFRAMQGITGGAVVPVGLALMLEGAVKERHGRALALWGMAGMMTPAIGPTAGGVLLDAFSWHWIFLVNLPLGLVAVLVGAWKLPATGYSERRPFDKVGWVLGTFGLVLAVLAVSEGARWGWTSYGTVITFVVGVVMLGWFTVHELRTPHPMLEMRMFSERQFSLSMSVLFLVTAAQFGRLVFIPLELQALRGYTPLEVGLLLLPPAGFSMAAAWTSGRIVDRYGARTPVIIGCSIVAVSLLCMGTLSLDTPTALIQVYLIAQSLGMGLVSTPAMVAGLSNLAPQLVARGTALRALGGNVSGAVAVALLGSIVATRLGSDPSDTHAQASYNTAFLVAAGGALLALVLAFFFRRKRDERIVDVGPVLMEELG